LLRSENAALLPIDEIERPIIEIAQPDASLFDGLSFLVFVLPLYVTLIVVWIEGLGGATVRRYTPDDGGS